jgi:hypothetical protein
VGELPAAERRFAVAAWLAAPAVEMSLRAAGLRRTLGWIEALSRAPELSHTAEAPLVSVERAAELVDQIYRVHVVRGSCLPRGLLQYWLLRRSGVAARFVVGARHGSRDTGERGLEAHAWVESLARSTSDSSASHGAEPRQTPPQHAPASGPTDPIPSTSAQGPSRFEPLLEHEPPLRRPKSPSARGSA